MPSLQKCLNYRDFFKPILDFCGALLGLMILSPVFLLIIFVQFSFVGNPFFIQKRIGKDGQIFNIIKFRSMAEKTDAFGNSLPDEKRITKFGKLLRTTSLDELPQLVNVLKGEMSLIGPRPLLPYYDALYNERQRQRNRVKPGITGLAQASGGNNISWYTRFRLDIWYVQNVNFCVDVKILYKTAVYLVSKGQKRIDNIPPDFTGNPRV